MAKVWDTLDTPTLLGCPGAVVQVLGLVHGHVGVVGRVLGHTGDGEQLRVGQILASVLVKVSPVDSWPGQGWGIDGWTSDLVSVDLCRPAGACLWRTWSCAA